MQFAIRRRLRPPTGIMVPLIDILLALLMFMVATSTFKRQPAIRLTLPVSREAKASPAE
ncbi:MAG: biopolymer transporter ExbD, partial [Verrucomicrobia bacterium]|nr:biopolymer transporter ExbD [Verrucomicrobiota bacterium]